MFSEKHILADRLGKTVHISPLRFKLMRLFNKYPAADCECIEQWLIELANQRGFNVIFRNTPDLSSFNAPDMKTLSDEELVIAFCQLQCLDYPQILRLAAQIISRGCVDVKKLLFLAEKERAELVLYEISKQALKVDLNHHRWKEINQKLTKQADIKEPIIHWTRLAEPVMKNGRYNVEKWVLVS